MKKKNTRSIKYEIKVTTNKIPQINGELKIVESFRT